MEINVTPDSLRTLNSFSFLEKKIAHFVSQLSPFGLLQIILLAFDASVCVPLLCNMLWDFFSLSWVVFKSVIVILLKRAQELAGNSGDGAGWRGKGGGGGAIPGQKIWPRLRWFP